MKSKFNKKYIVGGIITVFILVCMVYIYNLNIKTTFANKYLTVNNLCLDFANDYVTADNKITQEFTSYGKIDEFSVNVKVDKKVSKGSTIFRIKNAESKETLFETKVNNSDINQTGEYNIQVTPVIECSQTQNFELEICSEDYDKNNYISFAVSKLEADNVGTLSIDDKTQNTVLAFQVKSGLGTFMGKYYAIFCILALIIVSTVYYLCFIRKTRIEKIFLFMSISIGVIYSCLLTPFSIPDEQSHFETAYRYSNIIMFKGFDSDEGQTLMREDDFNLYKYQLHPSPIMYKMQYDTLLDTVNNDKLVSTDAHNIGVFLLYIPASVGITIARVFHFGFTPLIYMARLFNLLFYSFMIYFGMKKMPFSKKTIAIVGLLPISMQQGSSCSYDAVIIGTALFTICYFMRLIYRTDEMTKKDYILICLSSAVLASAKYGVYIPIIFTGLLIFKKSDLANIRKRKIKLMAAIFGSSFTLMIMLNLSKMLPIFNRSVDQGNETTSVVQYSIIDILQDPLNFIKCVLRTFTLYKEDYFGQIIGKYLEYMKINLSDIVVFAFAALLIMSCFKANNEDINIKSKHRICFALVPILSICILWAAVFTWNEKGGEILNGMQGRYLLPILPLILLSLRNNMIEVKRDFERYMMYFACILHAFIVIDIFRIIVI